MAVIKVDNTVSIAIKGFRPVGQLGTIKLNWVMIDILWFSLYHKTTPRKVPDRKDVTIPLVTNITVDLCRKVVINLLVVS